MRQRVLFCIVVIASIALVSCKSEKKLQQYSAIYTERPNVIYVAPVADMSMRRALRTTEDSAYNSSLNIAAKQLYLTAADPLVFNGYYVLGPLASAQIAATESRSLRQLRNENIADYKENLGVDAILFITLRGWNATLVGWGAEIEYVLRSTQSNSELLHVTVKAEKNLSFDFKGNLIPLREDEAFARQYGCDLATAQRCMLVEMVNKYVLKDLPNGLRSRQRREERYIPAHPEFFSLRIHPDGKVELLKTDITD